MWSGKGHFRSICLFSQFEDNSAAYGVYVEYSSDQCAENKPTHYNDNHLFIMQTHWHRVTPLVPKYIVPGIGMVDNFLTAVTKRTI